METFETVKEKLNKLTKACGLGDIICDIAPVSGGLMHKMYRVETVSGTYAVKCLNPEIMKRTGVMDNYVRAERLERILEENGLPVVAAISFAGKKMLESDGQYYYVFKWQEGRITDFNDISKEQCLQAGELLGRIHAIDSQKVEAEEPELSNIDFKDYLKKAKAQGSPIAPIISDNLKLLETAQNKLNEARKNLPAMRAVSDDDMDPKNIMWHEGKAYIIDLECLDYSNPISSVLSLALQWAGTVTENFDKENLEAFFTGYLKAYDNGFRAYDELYGISYTWVEWLEYNTRRALGMEGFASAEIKLGEEEVRNTIGRIKYLSEIEQEICPVLGNIPEA